MERDLVERAQHGDRRAFERMASDQLLGDPEKLGVALLGFVEEGGDTWLDGRDSDCQAVPLSAP